MKNLKLSNKKGFSLVELLVVIAVIGVIAAIAIPAMTDVFGNSRTAKAKRNAQNLASAYSAAVAAGAVTTAVTTEALAVDAIVAGLNGSGAFASSNFKVVLDNDEQTAAEDYLDWQNNALVYTGTAGDL
jgi:type IV pilus assembly protein PilA